MRLVLLIVVIAALLPGCSRARHRLRADRDAYSLLHEKTACTPWREPNFSIDVSPGSRLSHRSNVDDPCLPVPAPELYAYQLPVATKRDPGRFVVGSVFLPELGDAIAKLSSRTLFRLPGQNDPEPIRLATFDRSPDDIRLAYLPLEDEPEVPTALEVNEIREDIRVRPLSERPVGISGRGIVPIDRLAWSSIPSNCLMRTLEFESVIAEYEQTHNAKPKESLFDSAPRLSLEDLLQIAVRDSRTYQAQKEQLYRTALRLSQERYAYQLKFRPTGNGSDLNWSHRNDLGVTEDTLGISTAAALEKVLATGGTLLARFANDVVLTFNGSNGFNTDVSSELLAEITQPLLQRDTVFESLTQAERDVVYAARDYARFRKQFFRDIASEYYRLLLTYRSIEIDMLDFFANQRGFDQAKKEYRLVQKLPRFQVDQFEQNALNSRSRVIRSCNVLEQSFDQLKLRLGVPPETPINLDLTELEILTDRDEITVAAELARRAFRNLENEVQNQPGNDSIQEEGREQVINAAIQLSQKLQALFQLQDQQEGEGADLDSDLVQAATNLLNRLQVEAAVIEVQDDRERLRQILNAPRPAQASELYFYRTNLVRALLDLGAYQNLAYDKGESDPRLLQAADRFRQLQLEVDTAYQELERAQLLASVNRFSEQSGELLVEVESVVRSGEQLEASTLVQECLLLAEQIPVSDVSGLVPIDLNADEAMLTALVTRFDAMNERGSLADVWRQIKLAGDDLRSILNLRASQSIRTDSAANRPFEFTFDESETRLNLNFDAPLNRRFQRNAYRVALINYSAALRNLMQLEDDIKFAIRSDLRNLRLDREQYVIAVASAALASDRRLSTRKQLDENLGGITARDFLESQQAYTASLNGVASAHIDYILDRIDLFLDLELLQVDESAFWPELYDESLQPETRVQPPAGAEAAYGRLPGRIHYSDCIRRMDCVPFGQSKIYDSSTSFGGVDSQGGPSLLSETMTKPAAPVPSGRVDEALPRGLDEFTSPPVPK